MYQIALWARRNIFYGRCLIVSAKILAWLVATYIGMLLYQVKLILSVYTCYDIAAILLIAALYFYPPVNRSIAAKWLHFHRRKVCDFLIPLATSIVIIASVNNADLLNAYPDAAGISFTTKLSAAEIIASQKAAESLTKQEKKTLRKEFYHQLKLYGQAVLSGDKEARDNAWKIVLSIVALVGLLLLLSALACTIACNGSETLAIVILVGGAIGLVFGFIAILKAIKRNTKPEQITPEKIPASIN